GTVKVWDTKPASHETILPKEKWRVRSSFFSPDNKWLLTRPVGDGGLKVWDVTRRSLLKELPLPTHNRGGPCGSSPDGKTLVLVVDRLIGLWDTTFKQLGMWTNDFDPYSLCFAPDSRTLALCGLQGDSHSIRDGITNRLVFWDLATQRKF